MINFYFGGEVIDTENKPLTMEQIQQTVEKFEAFYVREKTGDIKIIKNAMLPASTAMVSPDLYDRLYKSLEKVCSK